MVDRALEHYIGKNHLHHRVKTQYVFISKFSKLRDIRDFVHTALSLCQKLCYIYIYIDNIVNKQNCC